MMHECKACKARITLGIYCEVCERQVGLLADIAALEAERDELQRLLDAVEKELRTAMIHSVPILVARHILAAVAIASDAERENDWRRTL
jgi:hypothetical protein